jgi:hypothetical protein
VITDWIYWLVSAQGYLPHGICLLWEPELVYALAIANFAIGLSYLVIPAQLVHTMMGHNAKLRRVVIYMVGAFIAACGVGHLLDMVIIWMPIYRVVAMWHILTATLSLATMLVLPTALRHSKHEFALHG